MFAWIRGLDPASITDTCCGPSAPWIVDWALFESPDAFTPRRASSKIPAMNRLHDEPSRIRIVLAELPPMLAGIVKDTVSNQPDMTVVAEFSERSALLHALETGGGDVVIVGTGEPDERSVPLHVLAACPHVKVLMLETQGRRAALYELRPHRRSLGDVSPRRLIEAIRQPGRVAVRHRARGAGDTR